MKIATLLQNKHESVKKCPFTAAPESFNNIVDKKTCHLHVISIKYYCVVLCHKGFHGNIVDFFKNSYLIKAKPQKVQ